MSSGVSCPVSLQVDVTFPKMPCAWLSLDAMDISGDLHLDVVSLVWRMVAFKSRDHQPLGPWRELVGFKASVMSPDGRGVCLAY